MVIIDDPSSKDYVKYQIGKIITSSYIQCPKPTKKLVKIVSTGSKRALLDQVIIYWKFHTQNIKKHMRKS